MSQPEVANSDELDAGDAGQEEVVDVGGEGQRVSHRDVGRRLLLAAQQLVVRGVAVVLALEQPLPLLVLVGVELVEVPQHLGVVVAVLRPLDVPVEAPAVGDPGRSLRHDVAIYRIRRFEIP